VLLMAGALVRQITLDTGEGLYQSADIMQDGKVTAGGWKSKGVKQRVHAVEQRGDHIWVALKHGE